MHFYWRFARGTLGVRGLVLDATAGFSSSSTATSAAGTCRAVASRRTRRFPKALTRELYEEGNIELTAPPVLHGMFFNDRVSRRDHVALFVVRDFRQAGAAGPQPRDRRPRVLLVDELPDGTTPATRARIVEVLGGAPASERW